MSDPKFTIGFLRRGYSPTGGVEVYLKGLARGLLAEGHRPVLLGTENWPQSEWPGGEILRCRGKRLSDYAVDATHHKQTAGIHFDLTLSVEKVPDCDIYRTDEGLHAAWLDQRLPYISLLARIFQRISPKHREKLRLERKIFLPERTRRVISISRKISHEIGEYYDYPAERVSLIRNGVPSRKFPTIVEKRAARKGLNLSETDRVVLFVGTGWERKGLRFAIRAVEGIGDPRVRLVVAGKGPVRKFTSPFTHYLGPVNKMDEVYAAADIIIVPSIFEPFSLAALEALGAGIPVITNECVGISEIMTPGIHGEVISAPSDVITLTAALQKWLLILADPDRSGQVRSNCSALASEFTLKRNLDETLAVIREVIAERE
jgi:UDP-glucose:(heptosyl)LPS alpha-1,3-glucosyltransferase